MLSNSWAAVVWMRPRHMLPAKKFKRNSASGRILDLCAVVMDAAQDDEECFNERSRLSQFQGGLMPLFLLLRLSSLRRTFGRTNGLDRHAGNGISEHSDHCMQEHQTAIRGKRRHFPRVSHVNAN